MLIYLKQNWFSNLRGDVLSALVVALALIPEAIAFSIIAGVDPKIGLYASFAIAVIIAFAGARPAMISAATGAMALLMVTLVREHGLLTGEVMGLEVCRVLNDDAGDEARLEIGVGAHDRETFQLVHGRDATVESLARVAEIVRDHRTEGSVPHPLNRLAPERMLRHRIVSSPELVGAQQLQSVEPPIIRMNVKDEMPCVAFGSLSGGVPVVVV